MISAASSGSGKTILSLGLITALRRRGLRVCAAKVGPDFIDAAHLSRAAGAPARNLDAWLAPEGSIPQNLSRAASAADVCVIEGVMGLFDGRHASGEGSTAHVARLLQAPVIAVLDCARASSTVGAIALGLASYDPRVNVAGVILNRVASERHRATVTDACAEAGIPVFGAIPRDERLTLESRHLGLISPRDGAWSATVDAAADQIERHTDLDALLDVARAAPPLVKPARATAREPIARIAVAQDEAFWFYDAGTLDALRDAGATLIPYSPMRDAFPDVDGAFLGGGYPELHTGQLEANRAAREGLCDAIAAGMPVYAECGGLMYLAQTLFGTDGDAARMVGAVPGSARMLAQRAALRYVEAGTIGDGPMFERDEHVRGHEFHYSRMDYTAPSHAYAYDGEREGYLSANVHASYVHTHLSAYPHAIRRFLQRAHAFGATA